jgi:hypothetical protein
MRVICIISADLGSQQWSSKTLASLLDTSKLLTGTQFAQTKKTIHNNNTAAVRVGSLYYANQAHWAPLLNTQ